jgi:hypothetical protein
MLSLWGCCCCSDESEGRSLQVAKLGDAIIVVHQMGNVDFNWKEQSATIACILDRQDDQQVEKLIVLQTNQHA